MLAEALMTEKKSRFPVPLFLYGLSKLILSALVLSCMGSPFVREAGYTPGAYEGTGSGYRGPIHVRVQTSAAGIDDIAIISHRESNFPGLAAMEELLEEVLETGETGLDAISGATYSSRGFLQAVEDALEKASVSAK
jgi:fumarate reductase flavoprotein subunit